MRLACTSFQYSFLRVGFCLAGLILLAAQTSSAQLEKRQISISDAIQLFNEHNLSLELARTSVKEWEANVRQASAYPNPSFQLTHEPLSNDGVHVSETYLNLSQPLEWPGLRSARQEAVRQLAQSANARFRGDSLRLVYEVVKSYVEAGAAETQYQHTLQVATIFRDADAAAEAQFESGELSAYRMRRLKVERARYENLLALADLDRRRLQQTLTALLLPEDASVQLVPNALPATAPTPPLFETSFEQAKVNRAELEEAAFRIEATTATLTRIKKSVMPAPVLTAGYKRQSNGFAGLFLGTSFDLPVFDRKKGTLAAERARLYQAETHRMLVEKNIELEVRRAYDTYVSLYDRIALLSGDLLSEADQLLEAARVSYVEGDMSLIELLDATEAYYDARQTSTSLLSKSTVAYYDLMRSTGHIPVN